MMEQKNLTRAQMVNLCGKLITKQRFDCVDGYTRVLYFKYYEGCIYMLKVKGTQVVQCTNLTKEANRGGRSETSHSCFRNG